MLYPQSNRFRELFNLSGFWEIRFDPENAGGARGWEAGFPGGRPIAVPASWNEQFAELRDYLGAAWYQTRFELPGKIESHKNFLRFGSVNYLADVWLNGVWLGRHEGGHLPFEFEVTHLLREDVNLLVLCVDGFLAPDRVPPGNVPRNPQDRFAELNYPDGSFDFFPYCGIHRPVLLYSAHRAGISDLTVKTDIEGGTGLVHVNIQRGETAPALARLTLRGSGEPVQAEIEMAIESAVVLRVPKADLWAPGSPALYQLTIELESKGQRFDRYTLPIGIRTVRIEGDNLLLNGQPVYLKGFGRHEDFPVVGRGLLPALIVKDYSLMQWIGANSFRTTHYPYSEQMMDLADRLGFLVIDETPAVGLFFDEPGLERRLQLCRQYT